MTKNRKAFFKWVYLTAFGLLLVLPTSPAAGAEYSVVSMIDGNCKRTNGYFQVPTNAFAQNFRLRRLYQGIGCETGSPINFRKFAIQNIDTDQVVFDYIESKGQKPTESPVRLNQLVLSPGNYALTVAGGADAVCEIYFELGEEPSFLSDLPSLNSWIDNSCVQHCANFTVQAAFVAYNFSMRELRQGTSCQTGKPIESRSFSILNADTRESVFSYRQYPGQNPSQNPCDLDELILPPGNYSLCVGGGIDARCILNYELEDRRDIKSSTPSTQVKSYIDSDCVQHCGRFEIPKVFSAWGFKINRLDPGSDCFTGLSEQRRSFSIIHEDSNVTVYSFSQRRGENAVEQPVSISDFCLPPGNYRLCVGGGEEAICILTYSLSATPCKELDLPEPEDEYVWVEVCETSGKLPNQYCPNTERRKFLKGEEPKTLCTIHKSDTTDVEICKVTHLRANKYCPETFVETYVKGAEPTRFCDFHTYLTRKCTEEGVTTGFKVLEGIEDALDNLRLNIERFCTMIDGTNSEDGLLAIRDGLSMLNGERGKMIDQINSIESQARDLGCDIFSVAKLYIDRDLLDENIIELIQNEPDDLKYLIYGCYDRIDYKIDEIRKRESQRAKEKETVKEERKETPPTPAEEDEAKILAEFRSLWPKALAKTYPGEEVKIDANAVKIGPNQYRCSYEAKSATGDNIRSLETLKNDIRNMKSYLGIK